MKDGVKVVDNENDYGVRISEKWHEYYDTRGCVGEFMCKVVWKCNSHRPHTEHTCPFIVKLSPLIAVLYRLI